LRLQVFLPQPRVASAATPSRDTGLRREVWLCLDRQFRNLQFVIRLQLGSHPPAFCDASARRVTLTIGLAEETTCHVLSYMGKEHRACRRHLA